MDRASPPSHRGYARIDERRVPRRGRLECRPALLALEPSARVNRPSGPVVKRSARVRRPSGRVVKRSARETAERTRGQAERTRETAERARETAERMRGQSERTRETADRARETAERTRGQAERTRETAERTRETAERTRETAERTLPSTERTVRDDVQRVEGEPGAVHHDDEQAERSEVIALETPSPSVLSLSVGTSVLVASTAHSRPRAATAMSTAATKTTTYALVTAKRGAPPPSSSFRALTTIRPARCRFWRLPRGIHNRRRNVSVRETKTGTPARTILAPCGSP